MTAISVIIANMNGERYLPDCLRSLACQTFRDFEVILVDNGSTDGSLALLGKEFPWVKVIALEKNAGFAGGNNRGFAASSSRYVATLNNDTIADSGWLEALYEASEADSTIGMAASKIYLGRDSGELDSAGMLIYPDGMSRQRGHGETDRGQFDGIGEVLFPSACAALYRSDMLRELGYFDEDFFSYCEDSDLGLRARLAGWKAVFAPAAVVRHLYSGTGGRHSAFKARYVERNRFWVLLKDFPASSVLLFPLYTLWRYLVQVYGLLSGRGSVARLAEQSSASGLASVVIRAYGEALARLPSMLKKRKEIWSRRRIGAGEYRALLKRHRISARELMLRD
ncbi:MAG: glycosyltransferase family 2 protein [Nitrospirae bacterium]|nr:glycosyltransferase family 2 protein [Nitrospirota bacterium]